MKNKLVFVFSGGGSRGALQVGAMYALLEYGLQPDLLIGVSIGAANAAFIALNGFSRDSLDHLKAAWHSAGASDLMPSNYLWLTMRAMFNRSSNDPSHRVRDFFIRQGLTPDLGFTAVSHPGLVIVSADLNTGKPILHGTMPDDKILDAVLLSSTLPPWFMPVKNQDRYLMDGAVVSNLPVEPAINLGATEIVALDLIDSRETTASGDGVRGFFSRLIYSVGRRQSDLEMELAEARGIPLLYLCLTGEMPIQIWDFSHTDDLIAQGYGITQQVIETQRFLNPILVIDR
jgi:NTE family protein